MKGIAYSVPVIIALVGALVITVWYSVQLSIGGPGAISIERSAQDESIRKMESTKLLLAQALRFGTMESALQVATQGGTKDAITYWYCGGMPTPPELDEVLFATSGLTTNYYNSYIKALKDEGTLEAEGIRVSESDCSGIYNPEKAICLTTDCESFGSSLISEFLEVTEPVYTTYSGDISADNSPIRFWMFYFRLYDYFKNNDPIQVIQESVLENCPGPDQELKMLMAYDDLCEDITQLLDPVHPEYIECEVNEICEQDDLTCLNEPCDRIFTESLCFEKAELSSSSEEEAGNRISLQGDNVRRLRIRIEDKKFLPVGIETMIWNLYAVIVPPELECAPID